MSNETATVNGEKGTSRLRTVLSESMMIAKIMLVWMFVAAVPFAYFVFGGGGVGSTLGLALWLAIGFVVVLGMTNVLLYVIARGVPSLKTNLFTDNYTLSI